MGMSDNKVGPDNVWYHSNMTPKDDHGSVAAKGDGSMANIPVAPAKDAHAGEESLGDAARRLKQDKAKSATKPSDAKPDTKPADTKPSTKPAPATAPSYKKGTDRVPATGPAVLHKDEAVLNKKDADKYRTAKNVYGGLSEILGGDEEKPAKEIKELRTRKAKSGGYIHEHHHTHPEYHPMEEHTSPDQDAMASHMVEHLGDE